MKQGSLMLVGKAESDVAIAINRIRPRIKHTTGQEREMLAQALAALKRAQDALRAIQPLGDSRAKGER